MFLLKKKKNNNSSYLAFGHGSEDDALYPAYFLFGTSVVGVYVCIMSSRMGYISKGGLWACVGIWLCKTASLVCDSHQSPLIAIMFLLLFWSMAPLLYYWSEKKMKTVNALFHCFTTFLAIHVAFRSPSFVNCVFEDTENSTALYFGWLLFSLYCLVFVQKFFYEQRSVKALCLFFVCLCVVLIGMQPLSFELSQLYFIVMAALLISVPFVVTLLKKHAVLRIGYSVILGFVSALHLCSSFLQEMFKEFDLLEMSLFAMIAVALVLSVQIALFIVIKAEQSTKFYVELRLVVVVSSFLTCYVLRVGHVSDPEADSIQIVILALLSLLLFMLSLAVSVNSGVLIGAEEKSKEKVTLSRLDKDSKMKSSTRSKTANDESLAFNSNTSSFTASELYKLRTVGNVSTVLCLLFSLVLSIRHLGYSSSSSIVLSCLLLLLSDDKRLYSWSFSRYLAPLLFASSFMLLSMIRCSFLQETTFQVLKNVVLVLFAAPAVCMAVLVVCSVHWHNHSLFWLIFSFPGVILLLMLSDIYPESAMLFLFVALASLYTYFFQSGPKLTKRI